ncbi:MAG: Cyclic di-GMP phosphodiesterase response regulator RpfG [Pelotomaculum sp. PtaU1.Bin035]|nr:MAG: Cyclic di-GMP phosphodiesterase response regulator RpfG [Pelotomaculum sp. PtaU1.Bin035]
MSLMYHGNYRKKKGLAGAFSYVMELERQNADLLFLNRMLQKKVKELSLLHEALTGVINNYNLEGTIEAILDMAIKITDSEVGYVMMGSGECGSLQMISARGETNDYVREYLKKNTVIFNMCASAQVVVLTHGDPVFKPFHERDSLLRSLMAVPLVVECQVIGILLLMHRHWGRDDHRIEYTENQRSTVMAFAGQAALILDNTRLKIEYGQRDLYLKTITALTSAIDAKDTYTRNHSRNVARYAVSLGEGLGLSSEELMNIHYGAILHDIGKIGVPETILNKPGRLAPDEFQTIKTHPTIGANILAPIDFLGEALDIVRYHHERYDGDGYPSGLKGESIPYAARVVGIADAWDAMTSHRSYRRALSLETAIRELQEGAGGQFDPIMINVFIKTKALKLAFNK